MQFFSKFQKIRPEFQNLWIQFALFNRANITNIIHLSKTYTHKHIGVHMMPMIYKCEFLKLHRKPFPFPPDFSNEMIIIY